MSNEPVLTISGVSALITSGVLFAQSLNLFSMTPDQMSSFNTFLGTALPFVFMGLGWWARQRVTPV